MGISLPFLALLVREPNHGEGGKEMLGSPRSHAAGEQASPGVDQTGAKEVKPIYLEEIRE